MKFDYHGPRPDGQKWPGYNGIITVSGWEAARMVGAGNAVYLEDEPEPVHESWRTLNPLAGPDGLMTGNDLLPDEDDDEGDDDELQLTTGADASEAERTTGTRRPGVNASRAAWESYAMSLGALADDVGALTKKELISRYGASL